MKSIMSDNIVKILKSNKYEDFDFLVYELPQELEKRGIDITVKIGGSDLTRLMFFQNMDNGTQKDITSMVEELIESKQGYHPQKVHVPSY